jgi:uncharacterized protein YcfJ
MRSAMSRLMVTAVATAAVALIGGYIGNWVYGD